MAKIKIKDLSCEHVHAESIEVADWAELAYTGEEWFAEANRCETCGGIVVATLGGLGDRHDRLDDTGEIDCQGHVPAAEGPMMNYAHPCAWSDMTEAARILVDLPVIPVLLRDGTKALALTGGGMDLSWEIAEAYVRLGYLPPMRFAGDLPNMARDRRSRELVLAASMRSAQVSAGWARSAAARIRKQRADLRVGRIS